MLIVDLAESVGGEFCANLLAMGGADVVRIERVLPPEALPADPCDPAHWKHWYVNTHKRVHRTDQATFLGNPFVEGFISTASVVITSFEAGSYDGYLGEDAIRRINPGVIHVTISPFGTTGPYSTWKSSSLVDWAASGYLAITGEPDRPPLAGPEDICAYVTGYTAAFGVEAALADGQRTPGYHLDVSTMEAMLSVHQATFSRMAIGMVTRRLGNGIETTYPLGIRPCSDGPLLISIVTDQDFDRLVAVVSMPELVIDDRFTTGTSRYRHRRELDHLLDPWFLGRTAAEAADELQRAGIVACKVATPADLLIDPQLHARHYFDTVRVGEVSLTLPGNPVAATDAPRRPPLHLEPPQGEEPASSREPVTSAGDRSAPPMPLAAASRAGEPTRRSSTAPSRPLARSGHPVRVLDATIWWAGPLATRLLADLGAEVVRIERPGGRADTYHQSGQFVTHKMHRGKSSLAVNITKDRGREIVLRLVESADVFIENFRPGVLAKFGLDYLALAEVNPRLIYISLTGFGSAGPRARWGSHGTLIEAASSIEARTCYDDGKPMKLGHPLPDGVGALAGAMAALRGLREREETGRGAHFDLSQLETYCATGGTAIIASSICGEAVGGTRNRSTWQFPQGVFPCAGPDRWVAITVGDDREWRALVAVVGHERLGSPSWLSRGGRAAGSAEIDRALAEFTSPMDHREVARRLQAAGVRAFPVYTADEIVDDPHLDDRGFLVDVAIDGVVGRLPGFPIVASPPLAEVNGTAPRLGQQTTGILQAELALHRADVGKLEQQGIVATST